MSPRKGIYKPVTIDRRKRPLRHGRMHSYTGRGCRCAECTSVLKEYGRRYRLKNPDVTRAASRLWHAKNKAWHTFNRQLWKHGLTLDQFHAMSERQDFSCAICGDELQVRPSIDHDHVTKRVRGLLCMNCNLGIGQFKDNPASLINAARYLEHHAR